MILFPSAATSDDLYARTLLGGLCIGATVASVGGHRTKKDKEEKKISFVFE